MLILMLPLLYLLLTVDKVVDLDGVVVVVIVVIVVVAVGLVLDEVVHDDDGRVVDAEHFRRASGRRSLEHVVEQLRGRMRGRRRG